MGTMSAVHITLPGRRAQDQLSVESYMGTSYNSDNLHETLHFKMEFMKLQQEILSHNESMAYLKKAAAALLEDRSDS
jgi:hypothetical protein